MPEAPGRRAGSGRVPGDRVGVVVGQDPQAQSFGQGIGQRAALAVPAPRGAYAVGDAMLIQPNPQWNSSSSKGPALISPRLAAARPIVVPPGRVCLRGYRQLSPFQA